MEGIKDEGEREREELRVSTEVGALAALLVGLVQGGLVNNFIELLEKVVGVGARGLGAQRAQQHRHCRRLGHLVKLR